MEKITRIKVCDICGREDGDNDTWQSETFSDELLPKGWVHREIAVVFTTDQNDGSGADPYVDTVGVDMCPECYRRYIEKCPVKAVGAQGYNAYKWR